MSVHGSSIEHMRDKSCPTCSLSHQKRGIYCGITCYRATPVTEETRNRMSKAKKGKPKTAAHSANISAGTKGKPKPWIAGHKNPNFQNKAGSQTKTRRRFLEAVRLRGQAWTAEHRQRHSETMLGPSNAMRGRKHSSESRAHMSAIKQEQYCQGRVKFRRYKLSAAEHEIAAYLFECDYAFVQQFHIKGEPYLYDFFIPALNLVLEYHGDYWHANPAKYASGTYLKIQCAGNVLVDDLWKRDAAKSEAATKHGYAFACLWEHEYKAKGMEAVRCLLASR